VRTPPDPFELAAAAAGGLASRTGAEHHDVAVVLGSGWLPAAERLGSLEAEVPTVDLPGFAPSTVAGHSGVVRSLAATGARGDVRLLVFVGRIHGYEGHSPAAVVHGVRVAAAAGCRTVVLTNAAGGIGHGFQVGQPVLLADHLNLTGASPLTGPMPSDAPARFVDLTEAYSPHLRALAREVDRVAGRGRVRGAARGPSTRRRPRSACCGAWAPTWWGCPRCGRRSPPATWASTSWACPWSPTSPPAWATPPLSHAEVLEAGRTSAERMGDLLTQVVSRL
jgi:purine-nucleoside phosphorylase